MSAWTFNEREFRNTLGKIAQLGSRTLEEVSQQQASLFTQDASSFTPPFGKAPVKESASEKKRIGERAIERDVKRAFMPIESLRVFHTNTEMGKGLQRAAKKKNTILTEELLRQSGVRVRGVVTEPSQELHRGMKNNRGRIIKARSYVMIGKPSKLKRYVKDQQRRVGLAKDGWTTPLVNLKRNPPPWVRRHSTLSGIYREEHGDTPSVVVGNSVQHAQSSYDRISQQAWNNRMRNSQKQLQALELAAKRKAREMGVL